MTEKNRTEKKAGSKFSELLAAVKDRQEANAGPEPPEINESSQSHTETISIDGAREGASVPKRGRPRGKRSDPGFEQVTAYIGRKTHRDVKIALLREGQGREFSELVEDLLAGWLASH